MIFYWSETFKEADGSFQRWTIQEMGEEHRKSSPVVSLWTRRSWRSSEIKEAFCFFVMCLQEFVNNSCG